MNDEMKNKIKAYLIKLDFETESDLKQARYQVAYHEHDWYAVTLLLCAVRRKFYKKLMADLWALLEFNA